MYGEMGMYFWLEKAEAELGPPQRKLSLNRAKRVVKGFHKPQTD